MTAQKPSWYSLDGRGTLSDIVNLIHPPYTLWHLSYIVIGIALSPVIHADRSIAVLVSYFLGLGIGAHALDETMGNPLQTKLSKGRLYLIGFSSLTAAISIGLYYVFTVSLLILPIILAEVFFALAYNLEAFDKRFHNTFVFALSWGVLPFFTGYFINSLSLSVGVLAASVGIGLLTYVQRTLSLQARSIRRNIKSPIQKLKLENGEEINVTGKDLISPAEKSLKALTLMIFVFAIALLLQKLF
ncbi:MAG TPA: hypothetical protein VN739_09500 [Nitrososphaerales archaeon]|nr:hypothetical protein [Nitrososphaerales archaeon]